MDWDRLITIEQMEEATNELLETGKKVGADSWQQRVKNQTPHCGFGEAGTCCRICSMGPCRITPKAPRGICGCDVHGIVGRNYLRFTAGGAATHSDHGRQICHTLYQAKDGGSYQVKDPEKLLKIAHEWGIETEGKDLYDLAHEVAETGLMEYGKPFGVQRYLKRAPEHTQELWHKAGIEPRAIDREVSQSMHMTHMGCSSLPEALIKQSLRAGLSDGWGGSMMGTEFSDILFGTPKPVDTTANIGVMEKDMVNIVVHGHDPSLSEMIVMYSQDPEMVALAKENGAKGINICSVMPVRFVIIAGSLLPGERRMNSSISSRRSVPPSCVSRSTASSMISSVRQLMPVVSVSSTSRLSNCENSVSSIFSPRAAARPAAPRPAPAYSRRCGRRTGSRCEWSPLRRRCPEAPSRRG